jgi:hypothetical protein
MALVHDVKMGKSQGMLTTTLFLDVCGAFNNVSTDRLLQTLCQLCCPHPVITWCATFLTKCTITLSLDGHTDQPCPTTTGPTKPHSNSNPPPLCLQQPALKPSVFPSDSDSQHSVMYLWTFSESSMLISSISIMKSEFSRDFTYPTTRNAAQTSPTPHPMPQSLWECIPSYCGPSS